MYYTENGTLTGIDKSFIHIIPTSDHNMHMDNPEALSNAIINDIYGEQLPLKPNESTILLFEERIRKEDEILK